MSPKTQPSPTQGDDFRCLGESLRGRCRSLKTFRDHCRGGLRKSGFLLSMKDDEHWVLVKCIEQLIEIETDTNTSIRKVM